VNVRPLTEADVPAVTELVRALETHFTGRPEMSTADLSNEWRQLDLERDAWLIELDGTPAGYAALYTKLHTFVDGYVHPEAFGRGIGARLVELAETEARRRGIDLLRNGVISTDERAQELLAAHGYTVVRHFTRMVIELDDPPPAPEWPDGLEPFVYDPAEAREFHAALEEAFDDEWEHKPESFDQWRERRIEAPDADPTLWFTVKDGAEIAATLVADGERYGMGWIGALGVRRPWRRRGLGLALLHHAFAELRGRGQNIVGLGVDADNPTGATRLYERAGMSIAWSAALFEKRLA
jgi:ribosomal protein S18 acetylase RimI-like enzyme